MKIKAIEYIRLDMPLKYPYTIAYEEVKKTSNIVLKLTTDKGLTGWGCAAPDLKVTGETPEDVINNIETVITELLKDQFPFQIAKIQHELKSRLPGAHSTIAMVDMALYDLLSR